MTIFYIKMKIRAGGGTLGQKGGTLGQQGAPPAIPLYGKHYIIFAVNLNIPKLTSNNPLRYMKESVQVCDYGHA